jgi:hypothetical protein
MLALLFLVLLTCAAWGANWYRYEGTLSDRYSQVTGGSYGDSVDVYVLLCYETSPWTISVEYKTGGVFVSGEFDKAGKKVQFRASGFEGQEIMVGQGAFNAKGTNLNLQG